MGSNCYKSALVPIVQALAPCLKVGCCVVIGLVPRTLFMDLRLYKRHLARILLKFNSFVQPDI